MKNWIYNVLGSLLIFSGIIGLILILIEGGFNFNSLSNVFSGGLSTIISLVPILFLFAGGYYLNVGLRKLKVNKLVSTSLILQTISFIIVLIGVIFTLIFCLGKDGLCAVVSVPFFALALASTLIGIFLLFESFFFGNKEVSSKIVGWSIVIFVLLTGSSVIIYLITIG
ncbi:hypothetical protein HYW74_00085 [Candidatus Pacearchaeota archaeon]|nr:hypothetical protein [Candidatus Pacearchaeota archaeon]